MTSLFNPSYNGNVSKIEWTTENKPHDYIFSYDNLSRLTNASSSFSLIRVGTYTASYEYDKHGNVINLNRNVSVRGKRPSFMFTSRIVDNLTINYDGNQLQKVDNIDEYTSSGTKDFANKDIEYEYNRNGAMSRDDNRGVHMTYQYYNSALPKSVSVNNPTAKGFILYGYTITGQKLKAKYYRDKTGLANPLSGMGGAFTEADLDVTLPFDKEVFYEGNMILENYSPKTLLLPNGYYDYKDKKYYFYIKDHLGNNRVVADLNGNAVQTTDYYPFGLPITKAGEEVQPYKFGGKEYDKMLGLDQYDFHARQYDPATIRFTSIDPLAEKYYNISPYVYCANNPIKYIDPDGRDIWDKIWGGAAAVIDNATGGIINVREQWGG